MHRHLRLLITSAAAFVAVLVVGVSGAAAKTPCWARLLNDEYDGHIDNTYPIYCYHQALSRLHEDLRIYGSAYNDISRALNAAVFGYAGKHGRAPGLNYLVVGRHAKTQKAKNVFQLIADVLGPGNATSIPLPILILGGVGLLLATAAVGSAGVRRVRRHRSQTGRDAGPGN